MKKSVATEVSVEFNIDFDEWNNQNSMKMSSLLQIITMEYDHNIDNILSELDMILDFVRAKYEIFGTSLCRLLENETRRYNNING